MRNTDPNCIEVQLNAMRNNSDFLAALAKQMQEVGADYVSICGKGEDEKAMNCITIVVGPRAEEFRRFIERFDDEPTKKPKKKKKMKDNPNA